MVKPPAPIGEPPAPGAPAPAVREIDRFNLVQPRPVIQPHRPPAPAPSYLALGVLGARVVK